MSTQISRIPSPMAGLKKFLGIGLRDNADWLFPCIDERRVFVGGIPQEIIDGFQNQAYNCITLTPAGYLEDGSEVPVSTIRVEVTSYGGNFEEASDIDLAAYALLKPLRGTVVEYEDRNGTRLGIAIYAAIPGGPIFSRDPDLDWACAQRSYRIRFGECDRKRS